jgi:pimeloyl-ACP methyl ester carboxylesterase
MPMLNVKGGRVHVVETGSGDPTLVLVHGAGGSPAVWTRQLEGLADAARVVAVDLPGHGGSSGDGCHAITDYAAVVGDVICALKPPVVLGGHSMGGGITQTVALTAPELLRGIVLVGTGARLRVLPELLSLLERGDYPASVELVQGRGWSPSAPPAMVEGGRRAMRETRGPVTRGDFLACDGFDAIARVGQIRLPALVIVGEDDVLTPVKYATYLQSQIPGAQLVRIPRAGHYVPLEAPDAVNDAIRGFLQSLR